MRRIHRLPLFMILLSAACSRLAAASEAEYELVGRILPVDGMPIRGVIPFVRLDGATKVFAAQTLADRSGRFKFKHLPAGLYTITAAVPRTGAVRKSVE